MSETQLFFIFWTDTWNQISNSRYLLKIGLPITVNVFNLSLQRSDMFIEKSLSFLPLQRSGMSRTFNRHYFNVPPE